MGYGDLAWGFPCIEHTSIGILHYDLFLIVYFNLFNYIINSFSINFELCAGWFLNVYL